MKLQQELELYGSNMDAEAFKDLLSDLFCNMFPSWNTERMMHEPTAGSGPFCKVVRKRAGDTLPEEMILRRLTNLRKNEGEPGGTGG